MAMYHYSFVFVLIILHLLASLWLEYSFEFSSAQWLERIIILEQKENRNLSFYVTSTGITAQYNSSFAPDVTTAMLANRTIEGVCGIRP